MNFREEGHEHCNSLEEQTGLVRSWSVGTGRLYGRPSGVDFVEAEVVVVSQCPSSLSGSTTALRVPASLAARPGHVTPFCPVKYKEFGLVNQEMIIRGRKYRSSLSSSGCLECRHDAWT